MLKGTKRFSLRTCQATLKCCISMRNSRIVHTSSLKHIIPRTGVVMWVWALQIPIKQQTNQWLHSVGLAMFAYQVEKMNKV